MNHPEDFALGALSAALLPRVFKEESQTRCDLLKTARNKLCLDQMVGLSPAYAVQGPEEMRYFGARLLTLDKHILDAGIQRPFVTTNPDEPMYAYDKDANVGDVCITPGGTPCVPT